MVAPRQARPPASRRAAEASTAPFDVSPSPLLAEGPAARRRAGAHRYAPSPRVGEGVGGEGSGSPHHHQLVLAGFGAPDFTGAAEKLADVGVRFGEGEAVEALGGRVE